MAIEEFCFLLTQQMVSLRTVFYLCSWRFYRVCHLLPSRVHLIYLSVLLMAHFVVRSLLFVEFHYAHVFENLSYSKCLDDFKSAFPAELQIELNLKNHAITLYKNGKVFTDEDKLFLRFPTCAKDVVGVSLSYFAKSSFSYQLLWEGVNPGFRFVNKPPEQPMFYAFRVLFEGITSLILPA